MCARRALAAPIGPTLVSFETSISTNEPPPQNGRISHKSMCLTTRILSQDLFVLLKLAK